MTYDDGSGSMVEQDSMTAELGPGNGTTIGPVHTPLEAPHVGSNPTSRPQRTLGRYDPSDYDLLLSIWSLDIKIEVPDLITVAQARYYMGQRTDGKIPPVLRDQVKRLQAKYLKRLPS